MAKKSAAQGLLETSRAETGFGGGEGSLARGGRAIGTGVADVLGALGAATVPQPKVLTPEQAKANFEAEKRARAATTQTVPETTQQQILDVVSALLGGEQGKIPQGYANFFTDVLAPMMNQQSQQFDQQLKATGADPNVIANLMAINDATAKQAGLGAQGLQQFVQGPLANYQKLTQQIQNALSFIPYSAQGIANIPTAANPLLQLLTGGGTGGGTAAAASAGQAPPLSPGARVTAGG